MLLIAFIDLWGLWSSNNVAYSCSSEATCTSAVRLAKAHVEENPSASSGMKRLATTLEANSERDFHKVALDMKLALPIPVSSCKVGGKPFDCLRMSDWLRYILKFNLWHMFSGLSSPNHDHCESTWKQCWENFACVYPKHEIFSIVAKDDLSRTAAFYLHGDEGRSRKKLPLMVLSLHSCLGKGVRAGGDKKRKANGDMRLNFLGNTLVTRFLLSVLPREVYGDDNSLDDMLQFLASDLQELLTSGLRGPQNKTFRICVINTMGDWPFLVKAGGLTRTFSHIPKTETPHQFGRGICHLCEADKSVIWEDFQQEPPIWEPTYGVSTPWDELPVLLKNLSHDHSDEPAFFQPDLFHSWHLGCGKEFLGSAVVLLVEQCFPGNTVDDRMDSASEHFQLWCRANKMKPYIDRYKLSRNSLGWGTARTFPKGSWSKGGTTTILMKWFIQTCAEFSVRIPSGSMLSQAVVAARSIDSFLSQLYKGNFWIDSRTALTISDACADFLRLYGLLARRAFDETKSLWSITPKFHFLHHLQWQMKSHALKGHACINVLATSTQMDEDFVGKASRTSRRVTPRSPQLAVRRTIQRHLTASYARYVEAKLLEKGQGGNG